MSRSSNPPRYVQMIWDLTEQTNELRIKIGTVLQNIKKDTIHGFLKIQTDYQSELKKKKRRYIEIERNVG